MEFGPRFELSDNQFMQMKRILIISFLCLVAVACTSKQAAVIPVPTNTSQPTSTSAPVVTATGVLIPDGLIILSSNRYKFAKWAISFSLPQNRDINNEIYLSPVGTGSSLEPGREAYIFHRDNIIVTDSKNEYPRIAILFETIPSEVDIKTYSKDSLAKGHGADIVIEKILDTKELGLSIDTAIAYKSNYTFEDVEYTQHIIHIVYRTTGIEIIMDSQTKTFSEFEAEFLYFLKNLTFGN